MNVPRAPGASRLRPGNLAVLLALVGLLPAGCVYDSSNRCGPHEVLYGDSSRCVCDSSSVSTPSGCVPCGEHELASATGCVCETGFAKPSPDAACEEAPTALGEPCSDSMPCTDATFDYCATGADGSGYCTTSDCADSEECSNGYVCDTSASPSYCQRPPVGAGMSCTSDADCAGTEATFCDTVVQHVCLVQGCDVSANDCFSGTECCDLSAFGIPEPICIPEGMCMP